VRETGSDLLDVGQSLLARGGEISPQRRRREAAQAANCRSRAALIRLPLDGISDLSSSQTTGRGAHDRTSSFVIVGAAGGLALVPRFSGASDTFTGPIA
jgi:hypothetical protein